MVALFISLFGVRWLGARGDGSAVSSVSTDDVDDEEDDARQVSDIDDEKKHDAGHGDDVVPVAKKQKQQHPMRTLAIAYGDCLHFFHNYACPLQNQLHHKDSRVLELGVYISMQFSGEHLFLSYLIGRSGGFAQSLPGSICL